MAKFRSKSAIAETTDDLERFRELWSLLYNGTSLQGTKLKC